MLLKDLIANQNFDINCYICIYDCTDNKCWCEKSPILTVYGTDHGILSLLNEHGLSDRNIRYITTHDDKIIIECK